MLTLLGVFIFSISALAMNGRTTYQAKIVKPDGYPLETSSVNFRFTILDPAASCVLYVEDYAAVNMAGTSGLISFALGAGTRTYPVSSTTFASVFDNSTVSFPCQSPGIYNPTPTDARKIVMQFQDSSGWQTLPAMAINAVPYAMYAGKSENSIQLNGKADTAFVENSTLAALNCNPATHAITFNGISFSCIPVGSGGGGGVTSVTTSGAVLSTGGTASAPVISIQAATVSQDGYLTSLDYAEFKAKLSASSTQIVNTLGYAPVSGAAVATQINNSNLSGDVSGTISSNSVVTVGGKTASQISTSVDDTLAATTSATANTIVKRNSSGDATFNEVYANAAKINYVDIYKPSTSFNIRLQAPTSLSTNYVLNLPTTSGTTGQVLSTDGAGNLSWINPSTGSVVSVSATAPLASTGGSNPTISITQATSSTDGYLSSTDWNTFNNKQAATSAAIIATLGYTPATSTTLAASFVQKTGDTMTGILTLKAGTTTNAPLKFTSGTLLSSAQSGTIEYDGSQLYFTDGANTRRAIATNSTPGSFDNTSSISNTSGNITLSPNNITGSVIVNSSQASISSGTGALVVNGGVGIAGSINAGGNLNLSGSAIIGQSLQLSSMTSGSLLFAGASGVVSENNSKLFWDGTNQRLGLGTNSPAQTLSVSGSSYFSGNVGVGTTSPSAKLTVADSSPTIRLAQQTGGVGTLSFFDAQASATRWEIYNDGTDANKLKFWGFGAVQPLTLTASGNVGIGTTVPTQKLHVNGGVMRISGGGANGQGEINLDSGTEFDGLQVRKETGSLWGIKSVTAGNDLSLYVDNNIPNGIYIKSGGNVGIGTTSPQSKLHVEGATPQIYIKATDANQSAVRFFNSDGTERAVVRGTASNELEFDTNSSTKMSIESNGNVGIGTASPSSYQHGGTNRVTEIFNSGTGLNDQSHIILSSGNSTNVDSSIGSITFAQPNMSDANKALALMAGTTDSDFTTGAPTSRLAFWTRGASETNWSQKMVIKGNGNVGVGTSSPTGILHLSSNATTGSQLIIQNTDTGGATVGIISTGSTNAGGAGLMRFDNPMGTDRMVITNTGNVGIGTTAPAAKLDVNGAAIIRGGLLRQTFGDSGAAAQWVKLGRWTAAQQGRNATIRLEGGNGFNALFGQISTVEIRLRTSNAVSVDENGFCASAVYQVLGRNSMVSAVKLVGNAAGCSATAYDVYVNAQIFTGVGSFFTVDADASTTWATDLQFGATDPGSASSSVYIVTAETTLSNNFYVNANVGIGTTNPSVPLEVNGDIKMVTAAGAPNRFFRAEEVGAAGNKAGIAFGANAVKGAIYGMSGTMGIRIVGSNSPVDIGTTSGTDGTDQAAFTSRLFVNSNGNVGIGTTAPAGKLDVSGSVYIGDGTGGALFLKKGSDLIIRDSDGTSEREYNMFMDNGTAYTRVDSVADSDALGKHSVDARGGIYLNPNGGNVGIGTTNPSQKLSFGSEYDQIKWPTASGVAGGIVGDDGNYKALTLFHGDSVRFETGANTPGIANERMRITSNGNVGIGTTAPQTSLDVSGRTTLATTSAHVLSVTGKGTTYSDSTDGIATFYSEVNVAAGGNVIKADSAYAPNTFVVKDNGNVGIGTASPGSNLEVMASGGGGITIKANPSSPNDTGDFVFRNNDDSERARIHAGAGDSTSHSLWFDINGANRMMINSSGNVGIGNTSPSYKLDVSGTIRGYGITDSSDIRLKKDIQPLDFSLEKLLQVNGVTYYWKNPDMPKKQIGFIAQQLEKIYPELVETDQDGFKSVNYSHLIAPVIESIKTLYHRTVFTERRVASLENEVKTLQKTNNDKEKQMQAMQKALCEMGRQEFCNEK